MTSTPDPDPTAPAAPTDPAWRAPAAPGSHTDAPGTAADLGAASVDPAEAGRGEASADTGLDVRTFDRLLQPRSANRLPLGDGTWHQIARAYVWVRLISLVAGIIIVLAAAAVIDALTTAGWPWIPGVILAVVQLWAAIITPRQARAYGYQLRADDMVFRHGIMWQRMVAVPYGRMQLVDIAHGPLDRAFGIARLKLVTAAASTRVELPGLDQRAAERLRDTLIAVAETRRTGL